MWHRQKHRLGSGAVRLKAGWIAADAEKLVTEDRQYRPLLLDREFSAVNPGMFISIHSFQV